VNLQPSGEYLGEDFYRAGGVPAVIGELLRHGILSGEVLTANGRTLRENYAVAISADEAVIRRFENPLRASAGLTVLRGNLFDAAVMKTSVISAQFRTRFLSDTADPDAFEGRAVVFDGPEDYHARINDPALIIDERTFLVIRGTGPIGYPGGADGRQSGTSGSPSILNAAPEAAVGGGLALLRTGDRIRVDLRRREVNVLLGAEAWAQRRKEFEAQGGYAYPKSQTPWQEIQRALVGQFDGGAVLESALKYQRLAQTAGTPRDSH